LDEDGDIIGWGNNECKQVDPTTIENILEPKLIFDKNNQLGKVIDISCGFLTSAFVTENGNIYIIGNGELKLLNGVPTDNDPKVATKAMANNIILKQKSDKMYTGYNIIVTTIPERKGLLLFDGNTQDGNSFFPQYEIQKVSFLNDTTGFIMTGDSKIRKWNKISDTKESEFSISDKAFDISCGWNFGIVIAKDI